MNTKALHIYIVISSILLLQSCAMNGLKGYAPSKGYNYYNGYEADSSYYGAKDVYSRNKSPWYSIGAKKDNYGSFFSRSTEKGRGRSRGGGGSGGYGQSLTGRSAKSYHFSNSGSPKSHKQRDAEWINSQNPNNYTIELAEDEKASNVAKKLFNTPKQERMAQYKSQKDGKTVSKGIYGSFKDSESAKKALDKLPADVRDKAKVKTFGNAQQESSKRPSSSSSSASSSGSTQTIAPPKPPSASASSGSPADG